MKKRYFATFGIVATAVAVMMAPMASSAPTPNLPVSIAPASGGPNTIIATKADPSIAQAKCLSNADGITDFTNIVTQLAANPGLAADALILAVLKGGASSLVPAAYFPTIFTDTTQARLATGNWNPVTGIGSVTAPEAPRPLKYIVAVACLNAKTLVAIDSVAVLNGLAAAANSPACVNGLGGGNPATPGFAGCVAALAKALLTQILDPNPRAFGIASFCLVGVNGEPCVEAAAAVAAQPSFTG